MTRTITAALCTLVALATSAAGQVLSNIDVPPQFTGTASAVTESKSIRFGMFGSAIIDRVQIAADTTANTGPITLQVRLAHDVAGVPGEVFATASLTLLPGQVGTQTAQLLDQSTYHPRLWRGGVYHLILTCPEAWQWAHTQPDGARTPSGYITHASLLTSSDGVSWSGVDATMFGGVALTGGPTCSVDYDGDGDIGTDRDIETFFRHLAGDCQCRGPGQCFCYSDFNGDGDFGTDQDIADFFAVLAGQGCP